MYDNPYFIDKELACPCCGKNLYKDECLIELIAIRELAHFPFVINSAYRCEKHNKEVGGVKNSAHCGGYAVDIKIHNSTELFKILSSIFSLAKQNNPRILYYPKKSFIHLDFDHSKPNPLFKVME